MGIKIITIGDLHCKPSNIEEVKLLTSQLLEILVIENPDILIFLGDQLDDHSRADSDSYNSLIHCLKSCQKASKELVILVGNHCLYNESQYLTDRHFYNALKLWDKTTIVDNVIEKKVISSEGEVFKFLFVCYVQNNKFMETLNLKNVNLEEYTCVFCHHEFTGTDINNITHSKTDTWPLDAPLNICGHLHTRQIPQPNLIYPGVPFQHSFNDSLKRTISIFEFNSKDTSGGINFTERLIELDIPKKFSIRLSPQELLEYRLPPNCTVKLIVEGDLTEIREVRKQKSVIKLQNSGKVTIKEVITCKIANAVKPEYTLGSRTKVKIPFIKRVAKKINKESDEIKELFQEMCS